MAKPYQEGRYAAEGDYSNKDYLDLINPAAYEPTVCPYPEGSRERRRWERGYKMRWQERIEAQKRAGII